MKHNTFLDRVIIIFLVGMITCFGIAYATQLVKVQSLTYSVKSSTVTVNTTALALPATALAGRQSVAIRLNLTTDTIFIGGSDVNITNGFPLDSSVPAITLDVDDSVTVYGIMASGTADVRVLEAK